MRDAQTNMANTWLRQLEHRFALVWCAVLFVLVIIGGCSNGGGGTSTNAAANTDSSATITYTITATAGTNGSVTPSGTTSVTQGNSQNYTITPNSGYYISTLIVDGSSVSTSTGYTFTNVKAAHTISATFAGTWADGFAGAPVGGNVQHSDFFTSRAAQSGQTYTTRPPWRVAGVDYPVGIPSATVLKDPTTASLPSGCSYSANIVTCNGSGNLTIDGYDFGLHNCIFLDIYNYKGTILIQNNNFEMGPSSSCQNYYGLIDIEANTSGSSLIVQNNVFNGNAPIYPNIPNYLDVWDVGRTTGTSLYQYNAFIASIGRPIETTSGGDWVAQYNYFEGLNYGSDAHGEIDMIASAATNVNFTAQFNTVLAPANYGGGATALWYVSAGQANGQTFGTVNLKNNTEVINLFGGAGGKVMISVADAEFSSNPVTTVNILNNYVDPTGSFFCYLNNGTTIGTTNMTGNINLTDGSTISDFTQATCHGHH